ncbi:MAG: hypothetical protein ACREJO_09155 [Phycisphaerales bacterium]
MHPTSRRDRVCFTRRASSSKSKGSMLAADAHAIRSTFPQNGINASLRRYIMPAYASNPTMTPIMPHAACRHVPRRGPTSLRSVSDAPAIAPSAKYK